MAVPKRRTSKSKKGMRRSHDSLTVPSLVKCSNCSTMKPRHRICPECGYYRGKEVIAAEDFLA
ncbi:MAG: 50S ribosomal protein L32 [Planctomycetota bacterium]|nr:50S ribosomal protein L32 [Planctomycetota bacterium]HBO52651.1 50S ribosomal protein L32 [Planctomycetota bacterium]